MMGLETNQFKPTVRLELKYILDAQKLRRYMEDMKTQIKLAEMKTEV
jgi:hypothetical protein